LDIDLAAACIMFRPAQASQRQNLSVTVVDDIAVRVKLALTKALGAGGQNYRLV